MQSHFVNFVSDLNTRGTLRVYLSHLLRQDGLFDYLNYGKFIPPVTTVAFMNERNVLGYLTDYYLMYTKGGGVTRSRMT